MRRALIADIHSNAVALRAVLDDCAKQQLDEIVCLGDMVGFGPDPVECVDLVMRHCAWSISGDHDAGLLLQPGDRVNMFARSAIERQKRLFCPRWHSGLAMRRRWRWLGSLEPKHVDAGILYVHGSPRDPQMEYVLKEDFSNNNSKPRELFEAFDRLCFCAHTHRPGVVTQEFKWMTPEELSESTYVIQANVQTLVNVGSVGQPRDGNPLTCYVIWDVENKRISFRRVGYDLAAVRDRCKSVPEFSNLAEMYYQRLERGM